MVLIRTIVLVNVSHRFRRSMVLMVIIPSKRKMLNRYRKTIRLIDNAKGGSPTNKKKSTVRVKVVIACVSKIAV